MSCSKTNIPHYRLQGNPDFLQHYENYSSSAFFAVVDYVPSVPGSVHLKQIYAVLHLVFYVAAAVPHLILHELLSFGQYFVSDVAAAVPL